MIATTSRPAPAAAPADHPVLPALLSRPYPAVMGVLNVTPDSFSDGGQFIAPGARAGAGPAHDRRGRRHHRHRRGIDPALWRAQPVSAEEELQRLQPVLAEIVSLGIPVSIDSMKSPVVAWALEAGAAIANDVWGLQRDPGMARLARGAQRAGHRHAQPRPRRCRHRHHEGYRRLLCPLARDRGEGRHFPRAISCSIPASALARRPSRASRHWPGWMNFSCSACRYWSARRASVSSVRSPPSDPQQRLGGSIAAHLIAAKGGARIIRTHDVSETVQALRVAAAIRDRQ